MPSFTAFFQVRQAVMNLTQYSSFEWVMYPEDIALLDAIRDVLRHVVSNLALLEGDKTVLAMISPWVSLAITALQVIAVPTMPSVE